MRTALRTLTRTLALVLFPVLLPGAAFAQQPHWTNATQYGMRVTPAIVADQPWRFRIGGNGGVVSRKDDQNADTNDDDIQAITANLAVSWTPPIARQAPGLDVVFAGASTYMTAADPQADPGEKPTWKANLGDAFVGVRYVHEPGGMFSFGGEAGTIVYGQVSSSADTSLQLFEEHPFGFVARGLATARTGGRDGVVVSANLGFIADGSYDVWKSIAETECLYEERATPADPWTGVQCPGGVPNFAAGAQHRVMAPNEDLRTAYGIYGEKGNIGRIAFGVGASKPIPRQSVVPFFEITGEMNAGELIARATPGLRFDRDNMHVIASADVRVSPAPFSKTALVASAGEPDARVNLGLSFTLGPERRSSRTVDRPRPTPTPAQVITVSVVEAGSAAKVPNARVTAYLENGMTEEKGTNDEGVATFDRAAVPTNAYFKAVGPNGWRSYPAQPATHPSNQVTLIVWSPPFVPVKLEFLNQQGKPFTNAPITVRVTQPLVGKTIQHRANRNGQFSEELPAGTWKISALCDCAAAEFPVYDGPLAGGVELRRQIALVPDPKSGALAFTAAMPALPTATPPPAVAEPLKGLFEPDMADLRPSPELRAIVAQLKRETGSRVELTINVKKSSDTLFTETLVRARIEALVAFFQKEGLGPNRVKLVSNAQSSEDSVSVLWR